MIDIQERYPTLEKIHGKHVEHEYEEYRGNDDIIDDLEERFFDDDVDGYQSEDDETYQKVADEIP